MLLLKYFNLFSQAEKDFLLLYMKGVQLSYLSPVNVIILIASILERDTKDSMRFPEITNYQQPNDEQLINKQKYPIIYNIIRKSYIYKLSNSSHIRDDFDSLFPYPYSKFYTIAQKTFSLRNITIDYLKENYNTKTKEYTFKLFHPETIFFQHPSSKPRVFNDRQIKEYVALMCGTLIKRYGKFYPPTGYLLYFDDVGEKMNYKEQDIIYGKNKYDVLRKLLELEGEKDIKSYIELVFNKTQNNNLPVKNYTSDEQLLKFLKIGHYDSSNLDTFKKYLRLKVTDIVKWNIIDSSLYDPYANLVHIDIRINLLAFKLKKKLIIFFEEIYNLEKKKFVTEFIIPTMSFLDLIFIVTNNYNYDQIDFIPDNIIPDNMKNITLYASNYKVIEKNCDEVSQDFVNFKWLDNPNIYKYL
jgi:hypothetical protein